MNDLTGRRFHFLTVVKRAGSMRGRAAWLIRCDCGRERVMTAPNILSGTSKSCGCMSRTLIARARTIHGMCGTRTYGVWRGINKRCYEPSFIGWARYGGRGISVCDEWRESFSAFLRDMGEAPDGLQIDRIDNDGNYCKTNCRWVAPKVNANNRHNNRQITWRGKTKTLVSWARLTGIREETISGRLARGWSLKRALTQKVVK